VLSHVLSLTITGYSWITALAFSYSRNSLFHSRRLPRVHKISLLYLASSHMNPIQILTTYFLTSVFILSFHLCLELSVSFCATFIHI
jgi:hypothetical protein